MVIRDVSAGEISRALSDMVQKGILTIRDGILNLTSGTTGTDSRPLQQFRDEPESEIIKVQNVSLSPTEAKQVTAITRILKELYPAEKEFQYQLEMVLKSCSSGKYSYQSVLKNLLEMHQDEKAKRAKERLFEERKKQLAEERKARVKAEFEGQEEDTPGTEREFAGTAAGQGGYNANY